MDDLPLALLALLAAAAASVPALRAARTPGPDAGALWADDERALERELARYRAALRAGTVCPRCRFANPAGSRYCADCGRALRPAGTATPTDARPPGRAGAAPGPGSPAAARPAP